MQDPHSPGASTPIASPLVETEDQLFAPFRAAFAQGARPRIGLEAEKFGIRSDGSPLRYGDPRGIGALFEELVRKFQWTAESEVPGGPPLALLRNGASITLEPGSQFELSGAPHDDVHAVMAEVDEHKRELAALESATDLHWLGLGFHPFAWKPDATIGDYIRWALSVPMFMLKRDGHVIRNTGQPFADFMKNGFEGHRATATDWETHLNTLFPEVRLKRTLEVRSADSVPAMYSAALPAIWTGVLYDSDALAAVGEMLVPLGYEAWHAARPFVATHGLGARVAGRSMQDLARGVLEQAMQGLARRARKDKSGRDERIYLEPLVELAARGQCIGDAILGDWKPSMPNARNVLFERTRY